MPTIDDIGGPLRRAGLPIALLVAAAILATGAQALAPAPAAAMVSMGEECDPLTTIDCEPANGGGGGGAGGTTGGGAGGEEVIGEAIYVEGTLPPSPCSASTCLPSQIGGGPTGFLDRGGKDPRAPRPRGRATRVGEVAKGKAKAKPLTKVECEKLRAERLKLPTEVRIIAMLKAQDELRAKIEGLWRQGGKILAQIRRLKADLARRARLGLGSTDPQTQSDQAQLKALWQEYEPLRAQMEPLEAEQRAGDQQRYALVLAIQAERAALLKRCDELFGKRP